MIQKPMIKLRSSLGIILLLSIPQALGLVTPNGLFCDHAVLQQGAEIPVWGVAREGEVVTVEIDHQAVTTTAKDGKWSVRLNRLSAGGPYVMKISGDNTIVLNDLLVGEVWLCSGQSNMQLALGKAAGGPPIPNLEAEVASAHYPQLRHFKVASSWQICTPETVIQLSAVGYFFGSELQKSIKVPVGLIVSAIGGTPAEAWTPREVLEKDFPHIIKPENPPLGNVPTSGNKASVEAVKDFKLPTVLYNGMIHPLLPYAMRGVIWYQGESNNRAPKGYDALFSALIGGWRKAWGQGDFPFLFVQLAPYRHLSPEMRENQLLVWKSTPNTSMVTTTDVGDADDIHPANKRPVGERLALAARALAYREKLEYAGPRYESMTVKGSQVVLSFSHSDSGLVAKDDELKGFVIAGDDKKFVSAKAKIEGHTVVVSSDTVLAPKAVRYGWENVPNVNLLNGAGIPASPFRTDVP
jgi:sialate O-acetylesterase